MDFSSANCACGILVVMAHVVSFSLAHVLVRAIGPTEHYCPSGTCIISLDKGTYTLSLGGCLVIGVTCVTMLITGKWFENDFTAPNIFLGLYNLVGSGLSVWMFQRLVRESKQQEALPHG